jgi:hypothetical protein
MVLAEVVYEFIYQNAGIERSKILEVQKDVLDDLNTKRKEYEKMGDDDPKKNKAYSWYFKYEKDSILLTIIMMIWSLINISNRYNNGGGEEEQLGIR